MENKLLKAEMPQPLSKKELLDRQFRKIVREKVVSRTKAAVVRSHLIEAYKSLEKIRFTEGISDTAFRDKITRARRGIESAMDDFLMSDSYWEKRVDFFQKMSPSEYSEWVEQPATDSDKIISGFDRPGAKPTVVE